VGDENEWSPNLENLKAVLSTTRFSHLVDSIVGMPDFKFHLGNFNAHWENKTSLTENQKTRKFAQLRNHKNKQQPETTALKNRISMANNQPNALVTIKKNSNSRM
jgi:hypothetical protein